MSNRQTIVQQGTNLFECKAPTMPDESYSGDKPNPNLRVFVERHMKQRPYKADTDSYQVVAFTKPLEASKVTSIYNMHSYHEGKKAHDAIRRYIRHYAQPNDLVLDPFCGSGGTALAALMEGCSAIAIDRSPAATFITKNYCTRVNVGQLLESLEEVKCDVKPTMDWLYETRCDRCDGKATTAYTVYSQVFQCPRCMGKIPLIDCVESEGMSMRGETKNIAACPNCNRRGVSEEISTRGKKFGSVPVLISYLCQNGCEPARDERRHNDSNKKKREYFEKYDMGKIQDIETKQIPNRYPTDRMMHAPEDRERWGVKWRAGTSNFRTVHELYTKRNLWALALWMDAATKAGDDRIKFAISSLLLGLSRMCRYDPRWSFPYPLVSGTYYVPQISKEMNAFIGVVSKVRKTLAKGWQSIAGQLRAEGAGVCISTQSATDLTGIFGNSVDYIFTDPPYADKVQYGEMNFVWETWLGLDSRWQDDEIIINDVRGKTEADWARMMRQAMAECYRVLKPGRWLSLCYHDTSEGTWALVQDIMAEAGFLVDKSDSALFIETNQKSFNQLTADKVTKRDLVLNFRKPKPNEMLSPGGPIERVGGGTFNERIRAVIAEYLDAHPGSTKDRVYDEVTSRMVTSGQMEAHNFDELLRQVAEEVREPVKKNLLENEDPNLFGTHEVSRWYLKGTALRVADEAESAKEDIAAEVVQAFIKANLKKHPGEEGVHYSDLFEHYIYAVKDKPRRPLLEWLPDYFFITDEGTYRLPASKEEEELKAEGRAKGTNRQIKRYLAYLEQGVAVPENERPNDATLAEWIRHAKRSGFYEQGKLLYEKGGLNPGNLTEEAAVGMEEDYQVCVRALARDGGAKPSRQRKRAD